MTKINHAALTCAGLSLLAAAGSAGAQEHPIPPLIVDVHPVKIEKRVQPQRLEHPTPTIPTLEQPGITSGAPNAGFGTASAFTNVVTPSVTGSTLTAPVTITYGGSSPVLSVADTGTNKGIQSIITNTHNTTSALFGQTNGGGAGLTGYNYGTSGPAGKFGVVNASSAQPGVFATTNGTGPAIQGTVTTADSLGAAILGQNTTTAYYGIGVEGQGNQYGLVGISTNGIATYAQTTGGVGVYASSSTGTGVSGESGKGTGVFAASGSGYGVYAETSSGTGAYAFSDTSYGLYGESESATGIYGNAVTGGVGIVAHSATGVGLYSSSDSHYGIWGQSNNSFGVIGEDSGSGTGVYGASGTGYAGYFAGKVAATSYVTISDRSAKTHFRPIDGKSILDRVTNLPITSWEFKSDLNKNHVGPMAQDFHAAFGLDGTDDTHINLTDAVGVSLASIQELSREMQAKDAQIVRLTEQLAAQRQLLIEERTESRDAMATVMARMTNLEQQRGATTQHAALQVEHGEHTGTTE